MIKNARAKIEDRADDVLFALWVVLTAAVVDYVCQERESRDDGV